MVIYEYADHGNTEPALNGDFGKDDDIKQAADSRTDTESGTHYTDHENLLEKSGLLDPGSLDAELLEEVYTGDDAADLPAGASGLFEAAGEVDLEDDAGASRLHKAIRETTHMYAGDLAARRNLEKDPPRKRSAPALPKPKPKMPKIVKDDPHDSWLMGAARLVPKKIREPWIGDLLEDRSEWRAQGIGRREIEFDTIIQIANILMLRPGVWILGLAAWIVSKLRGWFA